MRVTAREANWPRLVTGEIKLITQKYGKASTCNISKNLATIQSKLQEETRILKSLIFGGFQLSLQGKYH